VQAEHAATLATPEKSMALQAVGVPAVSTE
jgi:hypothetical protein